MNAIRYIGLIIRAAIGCFVQFPAETIIRIYSRTRDGIEILIGSITSEAISTTDPRIMRIEIEEAIRQHIIEDGRAGNVIIIGYDATGTIIPRTIDARIMIDGTEIPAIVDTHKSSGPTPLSGQSKHSEETPQDLAQTALAAGRAI
jgi:hypothetical protein